MSSIIPVIAAISAAVSAGGASMLGQDPGANIPLLALGGGGFDVFDNAEQDKAADFRAEYRFGNPFFLNVKPFIALEATSDGGGGAFGGLIADWSYNNWVFSPSFAAGAWGEGGGKDMGSVIEFRSQIEAGYRFDNGWRTTLALSHISNAEIGDDNPGAEQIVFYLHIPADSILPR